MNQSGQSNRRQFLILSAGAAGGALAQSTSKEAGAGIEPVTLKEAHIGTPEIDLRIMNQFGEQPQETQDFYLACREALTGDNPEEEVAEICRKAGRLTLGGPMLGNPTPTSVSVWMHLPEPAEVEVHITKEQSNQSKTFSAKKGERIISVPCPGLEADTSYTYQVIDSEKRLLGEGTFTTAPEKLSKRPFRISFGADFHKMGMYRPELLELVRKRGSRAMFLIGDSAVDGRKENYGLIGSDYLLRNLSPPIQDLVAHTPTSATWDDHDYWGNDTSGTHNRNNRPIDVAGLRQCWKSHWNNPEREVERAGIYFECQLGPVTYLALDTRSCRVNKERGKLNSFLGAEQMAWLKERLTAATSPFILISSGTMWSDEISDGKDSWGTWDQEGREEIFQLIDAKEESQVMLLSGDRHGARGFAIPRPDGKKIHEFEVGTLGGCPGPAPFGKDKTNQVFGHPSRTWAVGEFVFDLAEGEPRATFSLHNESGKRLERLILGKKS